MNIDKILNLQYRRVLTEKHNTVDLLNELINKDIKEVEISYLELAALFLIDLENIDLPLIEQDNFDIIKELVNNGFKSGLEKTTIDIENIKTIINLEATSRISDELNREIAIAYATELNKELYESMPIGIEVLEQLL